MPKLLISVIAAALCLAAAACGDEGRDTGGSASTQPTTAPPSTTPASGATTPKASTPSGGRKPITVVGTEFEFSPATIDVKSGRSTFVLRNRGSVPHALEIEGQGIEEETATIAGGETARVSVDLKPGRYVIYCPVSDHRQQGMEGTLTVS